MPSPATAATHGGRQGMGRRLVHVAAILAVWVIGIETKLVYLQVFARAKTCRYTSFVSIPMTHTARIAATWTSLRPIPWRPPWVAAVAGDGMVGYRRASAGAGGGAGGH